MSAQLAPISETDKVVELSDSPGRRLRVIRQARGLDLDHVAGELYLRPAQVAALEQDDYGALPGPVYVVGYMRNYARVLGLDPEPLIGAYRASNLQAEPPRPAPERAGGGHALGRVAGLAILVTLAGLGYLWWENRSPGEPLAFLAAHPINAGAGTAPAAETGPKPVPEPPPALPQKAAAGTDAGDPKAVAIPPLPPPAAAKPAVTTSEEPAAARTTQAAPVAEEREELPQTATPEGVAAVAGDTPGTGTGVPDEVLMEFTGPCWVEVRDSERKVRLSGEMRKGDRRVLDGPPPYSVKLGNAGAVKITVAGVPFDLKAVTRGSVARFTLNPD